MKDEEKNCLSLIRKSCLWPGFELASPDPLNNEFLGGKKKSRALHFEKGLKYLFYWITHFAVRHHHICFEFSLDMFKEPTKH